MEDQNTALATTDNANAPQLFAGPNGVFTTCDLTDRASKNAVLRALNGAESLNDCFSSGDVLNITDIVLKPGVRRSRKAGVPDDECINVYLIMADGSAYFTQSEGILGSIENALTMYPEGFRMNPEGYTRFVLREREMKSGNSLKSLEPVD